MRDKYSWCWVLQTYLLVMYVDVQLLVLIKFVINYFYKQTADWEILRKYHHLKRKQVSSVRGSNDKIDKRHRE